MTKFNVNGINNKPHSFLFRTHPFHNCLAPHFQTPDYQLTTNPMPSTLLLRFSAPTETENKTMQLRNDAIHSKTNAHKLTRVKANKITTMSVIKCIFDWMNLFSWSVLVRMPCRNEQIKMNLSIPSLQIHIQVKAQILIRNSFRNQRWNFIPINRLSRSNVWKISLLQYDSAAVNLMLNRYYCDQRFGAFRLSYCGTCIRKHD